MGFFQRLAEKHCSKYQNNNKNNKSTTTMTSTTTKQPQPTPTPEQKLITVFGATGNQGGAVIASLLGNKAHTFKVRGITRNPASEKALALAEKGVEVVKADGFKMEEMVGAFEGSWGVFVNTNSDDAALDGENAPTELDLGKIIVDAAAKAGVKHFVYSGMESASKITGGKIPVEAFDDKNAITQYALTKPSFTSVISVSPGWFLENFLIPQMSPLFGGFPHVPNPESGVLTFACPPWGGDANNGPNNANNKNNREEKEIPFISISKDYGDIVHGIFLSPQQYHNTLIQGISNSTTATSALAAFTAVTGKKTEYVETKVEEFPTMGVKALETVRGMFGFCGASGGLYYGVPNDVGTAGTLKSKAAEACGRGGEGLMGMEGFWGMYFGSEV